MADPNIGILFFSLTVTPPAGTTYAIDAFDNQLGSPHAVPLSGGRTAQGFLYGSQVAPDGTSALIFIRAAALSVSGKSPADYTQYPTDPTVGT